MRENDRDAQILRHIVHYCDEIAATIEMFGDDKQAFIDNFVYRNAVSMPILQIGELSNHLSDAFIKNHAEMPWRSIIGMRNRFAHGYQIMDISEIWHTATRDIPALK